MNKHKMTKEVFNWSNEDIYEFKEVLELITEAREDFRRVGVEFTYEAFKAYARRILEPRLTGQLSHYTESAKRMIQIIEGDNLDTLEDAAEKKGLL